ncbi:peptidoglycan recognition protein family protein [Gordoniibacillus kamchatkensis]|uniref:peptidoglycan recognition protein family protein n=1 Tax=Gordoniibacillus kamchatkensis TaxID=1590651 RepID=UPI000696A664|nr:peptidoglycan recognition family protein [Paenibacillus sp. VKM B-2647]
MSVFRYPVNVEWIPNLPAISYRNGVGQWEGVVMHYTDNPSDTAASERAYEAETFNNAFVHEFIDPTQVLQVANPNYIAYGAGPHANARFVHLELCHADTQEDFDKSYDMWCERAAEYLFAKQLGVSKAEPTGHGTLWSHYDVTQYLGGTTHTDPIEYLQKRGKTWDDVVAQVQKCYDDLAAGDIWKPDTQAEVKPDPQSAMPVPEVDQWKLDSMQYLKDHGLTTQDHNPDATVTWAELGVVLKRLKGE